MRMRHVLAALAVLVLVLASSGCAAADEPASAETGGESGGETEVVAESALDVWLTGEWVVETTLTYIDNAVMTPAADQPMAEWICEIDGETMYLVTDLHTYEGTLTGTEDDWRYVASSTYTDEGGIEWTSEIDVTGVKTGDDVFTGEMLGTISSDTEGHLYSAQWHLSGSRVAAD